MSELPTAKTPLASVPAIPPSVQSPYFGGCAFNIAVAAAVGGTRAGVVSPVGSDFDRAGYLRHLAAYRVNTSGLIRLTGTRSSCAFLIHDPHHSQYCIGYTYSPEVLSKVPVSRLAPLVRRSRWCAIAPNPVPFVVRLANVARSAAVPLALVGPWFGGRFIAPNRHLLQLARVIILNKVEFGALLQASKCNVSVLFKRGVHAIYVTEGASGSRILHRNGDAFVESAQPRQVVDPSGAGDAYAGGVLAGLANGLSYVNAARLGSVIASFVVESVGCQTGLPSRHALYKRYSESYGARLTAPMVS